MRLRAILVAAFFVAVAAAALTHVGVAAPDWSSAGPDAVILDGPDAFLHASDVSTSAGLTCSVCGNRRACKDGPQCGCAGNPNCACFTCNGQFRCWLPDTPVC